MRLERFQTAREFLDHAEAFLLQREAEHNLMLGLGAQLVHQPHAYGADPYFALVRGEGGVVAAALRTSPHNLILSWSSDDDAHKLFAADAEACFAALPGVIGPTRAARRFAAAWLERTGVSARLVIAHAIYRAERALAPDGVPGAMRGYRPADRELAVRWLEAFADETGGHGGRRDEAAAALERRLGTREEGFALWHAGEAVSLAGFGGPTPNGIRVGPVYTPPEHRRRGYASALVAELTRVLLQRGRRFCFLYTDLSNATANAIYQQVGYGPVAEASVWRFE